MPKKPAEIAVLRIRNWTRICWSPGSGSVFKFGSGSRKPKKSQNEGGKRSQETDIRHKIKKKLPVIGVNG
jgi:hypothetical protein